MDIREPVINQIHPSDFPDLPETSDFTFEDVTYPFETKIYEHNGSKVAYVDHGKGMPMLFLHGQGSSISVFEPVMSGFQDGYRILALDFPGFGKSDKKQVCSQRHEYQALLDSFVGDIIGETVWIVGHSLGGLIALIFAEEYPQNIRGLTLVDTGGFYDYSLTEEMIFRKYFTFDALVNTEPDVAIDAYRNSTICHPSPEVEFYLETRKKLLKNKTQDYFLYAKAMMANLDIVFEERFIDRKMDFPFPVHILWGEEDKMIPVTSAYKAQKAIPTSQLDILDNCGHFPILEYPDIFISKVRAFINTKECD